MTNKTNGLKRLNFYNTLSRQLENFKPINKCQVMMYTCGPTVYGYAHVGNMRAYIFSDTLKKTLEYAGYDVKHVMNITDVGHLTSDADDGEDKMIVGMKKEGLTAWEVSKKYTEAFLSHLNLLNIKPPTIRCHATDYIQEQIDLIKTLESKNFTYVTVDGVYFDTSKVDNYGHLARLDIEGLRGGERVSLGGKKNKTDFALWKFSPADTNRDMEWESPWGKGFPGWHIECSAMAMALLAETIDIHTGGIDHIPVHHTNEICQSESATGKKFANYWMHSEFLSLTGEEKMSKSLGNVVTVDTLTEQGINPLAFRYLVLTSHYRSNMSYSREIMESAAVAYKRLNQQIVVLKESMPEPIKIESELYQSHLNKIEDALFQDLNTPIAIAQLRKALSDDRLSASEKYGLAMRLDSVLSLKLDEKKEVNIEISDNVKELLIRRNAARADKDWALADTLRDEIFEKGFVIKDSSGQTTLIPRD